MKISKNYTVVKSLIDFADNPARDFSYMDERRKKQNARGWLVVLGLGVVASCVWLVVRLWK